MHAMGEGEPGGGAYSDMWGCEWLMPPGATVLLSWVFPLRAAETIKEVEEWAWPAGDSPALLQYMQRQAAEAWHRNRPGRGPWKNLPGIFEMCSIFCGHEKAMMDLRLGCLLLRGYPCTTCSSTSWSITGRRSNSSSLRVSSILS